MPAARRVFLSYASTNDTWVHNFCKRSWFEANLGGAVLADYRDTANFGSITEWIEQEIGRAAALVAFISSDYTTSKFSQLEWDHALTLHDEKKLVVLPVIMDGDAKAWWNAQNLGPRFGLPGVDEYSYSNFSAGSKAVGIIGEDGPIDTVIQRIVNVARLLSMRMSEPTEATSETTTKKPDPAATAPDPGATAPDPSATEQPSETSPVVILGHPTSIRQKGILPDVNDLAAKLRSAGISHRDWKDQWADEDQPAASDKDVFERGAVFIQPAAPADAVLWSNVPETMTDWLGSVASKAGADGVGKSRTVLWVPARHKSDKSETFDARILTRTEADNPIFSRDTPENLAGWIKQQIGGGRQGPVPVVAIEDMEAGDLREALQSGCEKVVFDIVKPPSEPWPFYNEESLEDQLRQIEGGRAIIAVHDLNTGPVSNKMEAQAAVESKIKQHMKRANQITRALNRKLDLFWTVLLVDKVKLLPMIRYPNNKLPDVTFLPFRKTLGAHVPAPDPQGAKIYQSYLKDWVAAPKFG